MIIAGLIVLVVLAVAGWRYKENKIGGQLPSDDDEIGGQLPKDDDE